MPNLLDATGLQTATRAELVASFTAAMQQIYGTDINLASDSPDGQMMNIFIQSVLDLEDLLTQIYNQFDPDNAVGNVLDQRVAINGIQRQAGTFTVTPVTLVNSQSVNLYGLDQTVQPVYTVADNAGNQWQLQTTQTGLAAGTHVLNFQAAVPGQQLTVPNTITVQVTIVLGVTSVNNPTTFLTLGINEETDAQLRVRRQKSVSLASQGYLAGLLAALQNISGVTQAEIFENITDTVNSDGVPGHSIWVVVDGSGAAADIAQTIYDKRNAGAGMFGSINFVITQVDGSPFVISWDNAVAITAFVAFTGQSINGTVPPNIPAIKAALVANLVPGINQEINTNEVVSIVQAADPNCLVVSPGITLAESQTLFLSATATGGTITLGFGPSFTPAINWNDSNATIQTKVRTIAGLSAATVTGTFNGGTTVTVNIPSPTDVPYLIVVASNSLVNGITPVIITLAEAYTSLVNPPVKKAKLRISAANVIIVPIIFLPATATVISGQTLQYTTQGGYGTYTYAITANNSGGSINSSGLYTAGGTTGVTDVIQVVDALGNFTTVTVSVP